MDKENLQTKVEALQDNLKVKHDVYKAPKFNFRFDPIRNNRASFFVIFARMRVDRQQHR